MAQTTPLIDGGSNSDGQRRQRRDGGQSRDRLEQGNYGSSSRRNAATALAAAAENLPPPPTPLHPLRICCILSTAFCYGCVVTTMFLLVLPTECASIDRLTKGGISKSVSLGIFAAIAGTSQLICPLVGMLSDRYRPRKRRQRRQRRRQRRGEGSSDAAEPAREARRWVKGRRMPYLLFGTAITEIGLVGINAASAASSYSIFTAFFVLAMIGINVVYCVMIALIPDLVPHHQTGLANGTLALQLVTGSLFGFAVFKAVLGEGIHAMYLVYVFVMATTCAVTFLAANRLSGQKEEEEKKLAETSAVAQKVNQHTDEEAHSEGRALLSSLSALLSLGIIPTLRNMIYRPLSLMTWAEIRNAYWLDPKQHHDFFIVTLSRLFYYLGLSAQCFFLYFIHDVLHERDNPEAAASMLAMVTTAAGAVTCYPVGIISDRYFSGRRKPFVYGACAVLSFCNIALLWCTTIQQMGGICATLGAANGVYLTMDTSLAVDTLDVLSEKQAEIAMELEEDGQDLEHKENGNAPSPLTDRETNSDGAAQLLGIWGVAGFVGSALGPLVGGPLLYYFGSSRASSISTDDDSTDNNEGGGGYSWEGYAVVLSLSACYFICSATTLRWIRDHNL